VVAASFRAILEWSDDEVEARPFADVWLAADDE
jgi:hypothetical protein